MSKIQYCGSICVVGDIVSIETTTPVVVTRDNNTREYIDNTATRHVRTCSESPSKLIPYLITKEGHFQSSQQVKYLLPFGLLTWYFFCWRFTFVTIGRAHLPFSDQTRYC